MLDTLTVPSNFFAVRLSIPGDLSDVGGYQYLYAVKADLLRRLGHDAEADDAYRQAFARTANEAERAFLASQVTGQLFESL